MLLRLALGLRFKAWGGLGLNVGGLGFRVQGSEVIVKKKELEQAVGMLRSPITQE